MLAHIELVCWVLSAAESQREGQFQGSSNKQIDQGDGKQKFPTEIKQLVDANPWNSPAEQNGKEDK
jgi:hypothetical protein